MEATIMKEKKVFSLYGVSKVHDKNTPYSETISQLLDTVWSEVKKHGLSHKGKNHVVYDSDGIVFAGIELTARPSEETLLKHKEIELQKFAYCKHIGPYYKLDSSYQKINTILDSSGSRHIPPSLEVYGHWHEDESKLVTEIIFNIE
ncbi:GyrI-like domain-containing protein [Lederbergia graminis]|uniref:GyrI-like domain-containing protein n=1 Tax=Lederbergia graminis TaxID=735518 RepID=A0ABW0LEX9_9BACI